MAFLERGFIFHWGFLAEGCGVGYGGGQRLLVLRHWLTLVFSQSVLVWSRGMEEDPGPAGHRRERGSGCPRGQFIVEFLLIMDGE